jgi:hypothetical protein
MDCAPLCAGKRTLGEHVRPCQAGYQGSAAVALAFWDCARLHNRGHVSLPVEMNPQRLAEAQVPHSLPLAICSSKLELLEISRKPDEPARVSGPCPIKPATYEG